jgi:group I intron endonuclease
MSEAKKGKNNPMYGQNHSDESKKIMSDIKKGKNHPNFGKKKYEGAGSPSQQIKVSDIKNNTTTYYDSISEAARVLNIKQSTISSYIICNQQKPYKGIYSFSKELI